MERVLERPVFTTGDRTYNWRDVVEAAVVCGEWEPVRRLARKGLACARRAEREGDPLTEGEVERAADAFRHERSLLAAEEAEQWLAHWGLTTEEWLDWVRRSLLHERWSTELDANLLEISCSRDEARPAEWAQAVCSGELEHLALTLAQRVAAHQRMTGEAAEADRAPVMQASLERLCTEALTPQAVEREVAAHRLEWTRLDCRCVTTADQDIARELAVCVREDTMDLAEVAASAGLQVEEWSWYLDGSPQPVGEPLLGAQAGDLLGPVPHEDGLLLCLVVERAVPTAADPHVRERAERSVISRVLASEVASRVRWHERAPDPSGEI